MRELVLNRLDSLLKGYRVIWELPYYTVHTSQHTSQDVHTVWSLTYTLSDEQLIDFYTFCVIAATSFTEV